MTRSVPSSTTSQLASSSCQQVSRQASRTTSTVPTSRWRHASPTSVSVADVGSSFLQASTKSHKVMQALYTPGIRNRVPDPTPPSGPSIALVFTDVQGSTVLWERIGARFRAILRIHDDIVRAVVQETGGYVVKTEGDAF